jgi:hypothetical protein
LGAGSKNGEKPTFTVLPTVFVIVFVAIIGPASEQKIRSQSKKFALRAKKLLSEQKNCSQAGPIGSTKTKTKLKFCFWLVGSRSQRDEKSQPKRFLFGWD